MAHDLSDEPGQVTYGAALQPHAAGMRDVTAAVGRVLPLGRLSAGGGWAVGPGGAAFLATSLTARASRSVSARPVAVPEAELGHLLAKRGGFPGPGGIVVSWSEEEDVVRRVRCRFEVVDGTAVLHGAGQLDVDLRPRRYLVRLRTLGGGRVVVAFRGVPGRPGEELGATQLVSRCLAPWWGFGPFAGVCGFDAMLDAAALPSSEPATVVARSPRWGRTSLGLSLHLSASGPVQVHVDASTVPGGLSDGEAMAARSAAAAWVGHRAPGLVAELDSLPTARRQGRRASALLGQLAGQLRSMPEVQITDQGWAPAAQP